MIQAAFAAWWMLAFPPVHPAAWLIFDVMTARVTRRS
jgi:hypothetical protein